MGSSFSDEPLEEPASTSPGTNNAKQTKKEAPAKPAKTFTWKPAGLVVKYWEILRQNSNDQMKQMHQLVGTGLDAEKTKTLKETHNTFCDATNRDVAKLVGEIFADAAKDGGEECFDEGKSQMLLDAFLEEGVTATSEMELPFALVAFAEYMMTYYAFTGSMGGLKKKYDNPTKKVVSMSQLSQEDVAPGWWLTTSVICCLVSILALLLANARLARGEEDAKVVQVFEQTIPTIVLFWIIYGSVFLLLVLYIWSTWKRLVVFPDEVPAFHTRWASAAGIVGSIASLIVFYGEFKNYNGDSNWQIILFKEYPNLSICIIPGLLVLEGFLYVVYLSKSGKLQASRPKDSKNAKAAVEANKKNKESKDLTDAEWQDIVAAEVKKQVAEMKDALEQNLKTCREKARLHLMQGSKDKKQVTKKRLQECIKVELCKMRGLTPFEQFFGKLNFDVSSSAKDHLFTF